MEVFGLAVCCWFLTVVPQIALAIGVSICRKLFSRVTLCVLALCLFGCHAGRGLPVSCLIVAFSRFTFRFCGALKGLDSCIHHS